MLQVFFVTHDNQRTWANVQDKATHDIPTPTMSGDQKKQRLFYMQQNTVEQLAHFPPVLWNLSSFVSLWLKRPSDYCSLLADACPMPTTPKTQRRLLQVFNRIFSTIVLLSSGVGGIIYNAI
tara:strand:+ start:5520 stop:5885 length:366 start_codon:yes stop_codon:yes gene_type:complete